MTVILRPSIRLLPPRFRQILQRLVVLGMLFLWWPVMAPAQTIEVNRAQLEYADGGWNLSADFDFDLPGNLEDAVNKGIALYFLVEFELIRPRWYWFDDHAVSATRVVRLSFHPLTRQYRVSTGGLQVPFSRLKDAVDFLQHVRGWRVFEQRAVKPGETVQAEVRMRLDVTQLPKPFQINAVNTRDWNLSSDWKRFSVVVPNELPAAPAPAPAPAAPPASAPASSPPASAASGLSTNPGWGMTATPSNATSLLAPAK
ncbi:DUF4390 domain-containing protein [Ralstonia pickettii]|uniref:DUF4390 domain-containing protein n=1 Tax=Ralstonia mannitolilytica TaxID=105219 RepID=UPI0007B01CFC|nr:DUF4390 domain-containing protein [Ralstonia mannitolilytica]ANA33530.1 hypothetical protein VZ52_09015 [Ralstonia mannitolilytica]ATG21221.1 DUF4390 domain-containing protein [Ralstonia pickettii]